MRVFLNSSSSGTVPGIKTTIGTTTATTTTIDTVAIPTGQAVVIMATSVARKSTNDQKGGFSREAIYCNNAGTVTRQGFVTNIFHQAQAGWDFTFVISGTNVLIRVKGAAGSTISWKCARLTLEV